MVRETHFNKTNSVSYESRHLQLRFETSVRLLRLIVCHMVFLELAKLRKIIEFFNEKVVDTRKVEVSLWVRECLAFLRVVYWSS